MNPAGVVGSVRLALALLSARRRRGWLVLVPLAIVNAALEAAAAGGIYVLITLATHPAVDALPAPVDAVREHLDWMAEGPFLALVAAAVAALSALKNGSLLFEAWTQARLANGAASEAAERLLDRYFAAPWAFHFQRNSSELIRNVTTSVDLAYRSVLLSASLILSDALLITAVAVVLLGAAPLATLIAVLTLGPAVWLLLRLTSSRFRFLGEQQQELSRQVLQSVQDGLGAIKELKVLGHRARPIAEFARPRRALADVFARSATAVQVPRLVVETLFIAAMALILAVVVLRGGDLRQAVPIVGLYAYAGFRLLPLLNRVVTNVGNVRIGSAAVALVATDFTVLDALPPEPDVPGEPLGLHDRIELEDIAFQYPGTDRPALRDVRFQIRRGDRVGVVGPTGSGKSTLLDLVIGLHEPTGGRVLADGVDVAACLPAWRRTFGYVAQATFLTDDSLRRNIAFGLADEAIDEHRIAEVVLMAQLAEVVAGLPAGLDTPVGERGVRLSGGQRQRIAIARALYHDPDVLVLDEATSSLDPGTEAAVNAAVRELAPARTVIVVAHRMASIRALCDQVVFLLDGRVLDVARYDELLERHEEFRRLVAHDPTDLA